MLNLIKRLFSCMILLALECCFTGAKTGGEQRPTVGLVLGGGGALGLAHLGVLQWLEEHRVPVDVITGTSMGAIIGGSYAAGYSSCEIQTVLERVDWVEVFRGTPSFQDLAYRRKEDRRAFPNLLEFGLKKGVRAPSSLTSAQGLTVWLDRLMGMYPADLPFEELPTPFCCIAADVQTGDAVELQTGPLAEAVRASAAIPGVLHYVKRDGRVLVDGGVADNLPVRTARKMGAEFVVAVPLPLADLDEKEMLTITGLLSRSVSVAILQNERQSMKLADLVIEPQTGKYTGTHYEAFKELIAIGWQAAEKTSACLLPHAVSALEYNRYAKARESRRRKEMPGLQFVEVQGGSEKARKSVTKTLQKEIAKTGSLERMDRHLAYEFGSMRYSAISRTETERNGQTGLQVKLVEKRHAPPFVFVAPIIDGYELDNVTFTLNSRLALIDLGSYGSEVRLDLGFGGKDVAGVEYYRRFGQQGFFVAPRAIYFRQKTSLIYDETHIGEYNQKQSELGLDLGFSTARSFETRAGFASGNVAFPVRSGIPLPENQEGTFRYFSLQATFNQQDNPIIPRHGLRASGDLRYYLNAPGTGEFILLNLEGSYFLSISPRNLVFVSTRGGSSFGQTLPFALTQNLGGPIRLGAYSRDEFRGDRMAYGNAGYLRKIGSLPPILGGDLFLGGWYELGATSRSHRKEFRQDGTLGFIAETPVGPFFLGGSFGGGGRGRVSFMLGRFF